MTEPSTTHTTKDGNTEPHSLPQAKLTAISRFKTFATSSLSLKKRESKIIFPPPSWFINDNESSSSLNSSGGDSKDSVHIEPGEETVDIPEPTTFALKIRQLIDSLPLPTSISAAIGASHGTGALEHRCDSPDVAVPVDEKGPPIPDPVDAKTMRLLSSENVMNGEDDPKAHGTKRPSIWSILERMTPRNAISKSVETPTTAGPSVPEIDHEPDVMMYAPLEPTPDSEVELAESINEYPINEDEEQSQGKGKAPETSPLSPPPLEKHWVPSTTKMSILTTWWGYRLYLPPPVMATLDSSQLKATQRAALITTALTWFLNKVPTMMLPAPAIPAVRVLRRLSPLLSYIGIFIAWSWTRICACDKGNGVVLTATWLLPVALIPMSWDAGDIQGPPNQPHTLNDPGDEPSASSSTPKSGEKGKKNAKTKARK